MPLYQQIIITLPKVTKEALVGLFKRHSNTVLENKGNLRAIENHGIRPLPERTRRFVGFHVDNDTNPGITSS
jgi:ribosomal protein S6